jgi:DNA-binding LacI/PurR family transcriptional regulator
MSGWQNINLTTIRIPINGIVDASIELIAAILDQPEFPPQARLFECDVVERGTLLRR